MIGFYTQTKADSTFRELLNQLVQEEPSESLDPKGNDDDLGSEYRRPL